MENVMTKKIKSSATYKFQYGLPGFEHLSEFEFVDLDEYPPFKLFRSTSRPEISMIVMDGQLLKIYETINLPRHELNILNLRDKEYLRIFVILRVDEKTKSFVANTKAPIILNTYNGLGKQIIIDNSSLSEEFKLENF